MKSHEWVPLAIVLMGAAVCHVSGHPELIGLGLMVVAGLLRIIWGIEELYERDHPHG